MKKTKSVQKLITFPSGLYSRILERADNAGVYFSDYVKYLVLHYLENNIETLDSEQSKEISKSWDEFQKGNYHKVDPFDDKSFDSLVK